MTNNLTRFSRAGDEFHYRWAARRCLKLIHPKSQINKIIIEGSQERNVAGEYIIDVSEYINSNNERNSINYYQLKHTSVQKENPFQLSDLKDTFEGFAQRFKELTRSKENLISFFIITNRPFSKYFKNNLSKIKSGLEPSIKFKKTILKYTGLTEKEIEKFCASIKIIDNEGDYNAQRHYLHFEIKQLLAGVVENTQIDTITKLVQEKALPDSNGTIVREEILQRFGVTSEKELFPAPAAFESIDKLIPREEHNTILECLLDETRPAIIHAPGGVGKSVFAQQLITSLPLDSMGVAYDCFGGGRYRNRSEPRHRHRDALVQIANELSTQGYCDPIIAAPNSLEDDILKKFLERLQVSINCLKKENKSALIFIIIDAADNAEMAAQEYNQPCFAHELLRETFPEGCRLIMLCRTERRQLLKPTSRVVEFELKPFTESETLSHLKQHFNNAKKDEGVEFHRLTGGNPRVQANALIHKNISIEEVLKNLGPDGMTVNKQIELQLETAVNHVKDIYHEDYQKKIKAICTGLASFPPFIPIEVLAKAAEVEEATVISFASDLGRPIWIADSSVQFRDEPTETWFRSKFIAEKEKVLDYIDKLKPLAEESPYISAALPSLLHQANRHSELIELALSDTLLPENSPIDARNIRIYRLQFAFKAALKQKRYSEAIKLALRASEEVSGDERQNQLLQNNIDLIAPLQREEKVQEMAFQRKLCSAWDGSENLFSAALLSSIMKYRGEAKVFLRSAKSWLRLYFQQKGKKPKSRTRGQLQTQDIVELCWTHFNLYDVQSLVKVIQQWRPLRVTYEISRIIVSRLIDRGNFHTVKEFIKHGIKNYYLVLAAFHELLLVGRIPEQSTLSETLKTLNTQPPEKSKPGSLNKKFDVPSLLEFLEACAAANLPKNKILKILENYIPTRAPIEILRMLGTEERQNYLRSLALKCVFNSKLQPNVEELLPKELIGKENRYDNDLRTFIAFINGLLPWYIIRIKFITGSKINLDSIKEANRKSQKILTEKWRAFERVPYELSQVYIDILVFMSNENRSFIEFFFKEYLRNNPNCPISYWTHLTRCANRLKHLSPIKDGIEECARAAIESATELDPETTAQSYIDLTRASLINNKEDAATYFDFAIEAVSKFGYEIGQRWESITALANRSADGGTSTPEMAYRFIRGAELVGEQTEHFDRDTAVRACTRLSPHCAIATLSRWRDRDVGWIYDLLPVLADQLMMSGFISPTIGWSFSTFLETHELANLSVLCLQNECDNNIRLNILNSAVKELDINNASHESWKYLNDSSQKLSLHNQRLKEVYAHYKENPVSRPLASNSSNSQFSNEEEIKIDWERLFNGCDLTQEKGIKLFLERCSRILKYEHEGQKWIELFNRLPENQSLKFLSMLSSSTELKSHQVESALTNIPSQWKKRVSFQIFWPNFILKIVRKFSIRYVYHYNLSHLTSFCEIPKELIPSIYEAIFDGLADQYDLNTANTFLEFSKLAAQSIPPQEAAEALDFSLSRLELHIKEDFGDGSWADWLDPPEDISNAFTGFLWSALGSPRSEIRWRAAHSVRILAEANCQSEIDYLMEWMKSDRVASFGCKNLPFYNFHARLYLLIALARASHENPETLNKHSNIFISHSLGTFSHILIQIFSAEIALNIENSYPGTFNTSTLKKLKNVSASSFPVKKVELGTIFDSYWHKKGEQFPKFEFYHGYDMERYWLGHLGRVFGVSEPQMIDLVNQVLFQEWKIDVDGSYLSEPRKYLFSSSNKRETSHSHGSYPRTDDYCFYLSYHAMLCVASKLLKKMPVLDDNGWDEDKWSGWLQRHCLTREDGQWLADSRGPVPFSKPDWLHQRDDDRWLNEKTPHDFLKGLLSKNDREYWLTISGNWCECDSYRTENYQVYSALVSSEASQSLMNALSTCQSLYDFRLPGYEETDYEIETGLFKLKGWIKENDNPRYLDGFDPCAGSVPFPPTQVGPPFIKLLHLRSDLTKQKWYLPKSQKPSIIFDLWSTSKPNNNDDDPWRYGGRMNASPCLIKKLCQATNCDLILEVQINRSFKKNHFTRREYDKSSQTRSHQIFLFSRDGRLRDAETYYRIGKISC